MGKWHSMDVNIRIIQEKSLELYPKCNGHSIHGKCCFKFRLKGNRAFRFSAGSIALYEKKPID